MINLTDINYKYPKKKQFALSDISFCVQPGEIFTLLGPNGAGKTTLIRILSGLIIPREGTVSIDGYDIQLEEYKARQKIGLVLGDERTFYFRLSGAQNLEFFGGLYGLRRSYLKNRIREVLTTVGLENDATLQYMRYSTGMKKRLSMARALLHDPDIFLLDEPNSGVDPFSARKIRDIIYSLKERRKTILLTTHNMDEAEKMSDRIGFLKDGQLIKIGKTDEFKNLIARKVLEIDFGSPSNPTNMSILSNLASRIENETGCDSVELKDNSLKISYNGSFNLNQALDIIIQKNLTVRRTNTKEASLEDIFIKLAG